MLLLAPGRPGPAASYYPQLNASGGYDHTWNDADGRSFSKADSTRGRSSNNDSEDHYTLGISVSQLVYDFGKTPALVEKSDQSLESARKKLTTIENTLIMDVKRSYFEVLKSQHLAIVRSEAVPN